MKLHKLFRIILLLATIAFSQAASAQFGPAPGDCQLLDGQLLKGTTRMVLATTQAASTLIYSKNFESQEFSPDQIRSCRIGKRRFITGGNFVAPDDQGGISVDVDFIEVIDTTGQVQVFAYTYEQYVANGQALSGGMGGVGMGGVPGGPGWSSATYYPHTVYLLRAKGSRLFTPYSLQPNTDAILTRRKLDHSADLLTLQSLFAKDAVLQQELAAGKIREKAIPGVVADYNSGIKRRAVN